MNGNAVGIVLGICILQHYALIKTRYLSIYLSRGSIN